MRIMSIGCLRLVFVIYRHVKYLQQWCRGSNVNVGQEELEFIHS